MVVHIPGGLAIVLRFEAEPSNVGIPKFVYDYGTKNATSGTKKTLQEYSLFQCDMMISCCLKISWT